MQYTQQQRLAPEAPDESALYSPIPPNAQYTPPTPTVEVSRVGAVNAPVGGRDPVYNFLCC